MSTMFPIAPGLLSSHKDSVIEYVLPFYISSSHYMFELPVKRKFLLWAFLVPPSEEMFATVMFIFSISEFHHGGC